MKKIGKINWIQTIFVAIFTGFFMRMLAQSNLIGGLIFISNILGGLLCGAIFGARK